MTAPAAQPEAALVSTDPDLIERVGDAAAAAGCALHVLTGPSQHGSGGARALMLGLDAFPALARSGVPRASEALVIGPDDRLPQLWQAAGELGAAGVASLPTGSEWLVQWLHDRGAGTARRSTVVAAVFGAAGGIGTSTIAAAVAVTAGRSGLHPLLIEAHPGPAGAGLLLGETDVAEHWPRFARIRGFLQPDALDVLPVLEGVRCLGWGCGEEVPLWQGALGSVLAAARRDHDLVVLDGGLHPTVVEELPRQTRAVLVVPASWRGVLAVRPRMISLRAAFDPPPVVVLRDVGGRGDPRAWAKEFVDCPVHMWGFDASVIDDEEQCRPPGTRPRSKVGRLSRQVLASLAERPEAA